MKLYNLGKIPWADSQLIYHALAHLGIEALSLVSPASPYVCIGYFQDVEQEVDLDFCRQQKIPVFRRDLGGGAVYLDGNQLFFQLILHKDHPLVPQSKASFYGKFLQPIVHVYRHIGIEAEYKPINDILAGNRKISGTGVGEIGDYIVFVGNLILDFNYEMMARVLKVPDEKFRDKVHKTLIDNLSTIRREIGLEEAKRWDEGKLNQLMTEAFERVVGEMEPSSVEANLQAKMESLRGRMLSEAWLFKKGGRKFRRDVKIRTGMNVVHRVHKAPGGLIRADFVLSEGKIRNVSLSGDFFFFPGVGVSRLESSLEGQPLKEIRALVTEFYGKEEVETPGVEIDDWVQVFGL